MKLLKRLSGPLALIFIGFLIGFFVMAHLSREASVYFATISLSEAKLDEQISAIKAKKHGDYEDAIYHYKNVDAIDRYLVEHAKDRSKDVWIYLFPLTSIATAAVLSSMRYDVEKVRKASKATNLGLIADMMEKAGRKDEAESKYQEAASLLGNDYSVEKVRKMIVKMTLSEDKLLKD